VLLYISVSFVCSRLLDVVSAKRTHHELQLMLIFEHVDQDLAQYLEKHASGLSPESIQACIQQFPCKLCCQLYCCAVQLVIQP